LEILQKTFPKSCDLDPIPVKLLYEKLDVLLPTVTNINTSMAFSQVPPDFKTVIVKPLLKQQQEQQEQEEEQQQQLPLTKMY